jgi:ankyrin repeat protein
MVFNAVVAFLVWSQVTVAQDNGFKLRQAVAAGDVVTVTKLASSKAIVNSANADGVTPLMIASANGQTKIVKVLLKAGANVEAKTSVQEVTALMFAALVGHLDVAQELVSGGANIKASDKDNNTAIDYSILVFKDETKEQRENALAVGKYLKSKGAEVRLSPDNFLGRLLAVYSGDDALALIKRAKAAKQ